MFGEQKLRVAVIGRTGKGNYGHDLDGVWLKVPTAEIVAVADENEKGRADAARRLKAKAAYADYREMLRKERPQVVSVADRWPDCHRDMVVACAENGASIFLEKPVSQTMQEADEMLTACARHHVKCAVAHQTRYSPRVKAVKDLIAAGRIGDVVELRGHGKEDARGGGEDMMVLGTHAFDLMRLLVGDPKWCFARVSQGGRKAGAGDARQGREPIGPIAGDHIHATFGFAGLPVGTFVTHKARDGANTRYWLEIRGTKGVIHVGYGAFPPAYLCEDPSWMPGKSKAPWQEISSAGVGKPEPLKPGDYGNGNIWIVEDLLAAIKEDRPPVCSLADGAAAVEMVLAVYESNKLDRPVEFPLKNRKHPLAG
jgi:predicted dehydrogenase